MTNKLFGATAHLEKAMDASALRSHVIANNIANAETPGFKSSAVEFESVFANALKAEKTDFQNKTTNEKHITFSASLEKVNPIVIKNTDTSMRMDGNNVDIDYQNAQLAKNQIYFNVLTEKLNSEFSKLKAAIQG